MGTRTKSFSTTVASLALPQTVSNRSCKERRIPKIGHTQCFSRLQRKTQSEHAFWGRGRPEGIFASSFSKTQSLPRQPPPSSPPSSSPCSSSPSPSSTPKPAWGPPPPSSQTVVEPAPPPWWWRPRHRRGSPAQRRRSTPPAQPRRPPRWIHRGGVHHRCLEPRGRWPPRALAAGHVANSRAGTSPAGAARTHLCRALAATGTSAGGRISTGRGGRRERESGGRERVEGDESRRRLLLREKGGGLLEKDGFGLGTYLLCMTDFWV